MFSENIIQLKTILCRNLFPPKLIDKTISDYLNKQMKIETKVNESSAKGSYFKLPYIGEYSMETKRKIRILCKTYCKSTEINISHSMTKVGDYFSAKCRVPDYLKSFVVYHFVCASCGASYVGETTRYFSTRVHEHLNKSKPPSNIFSHINSNMECRNACDINSFKIIDRANTKFTLKVKEALNIQWLNPSLNKQKTHLAVTISI